MSKRRLFPFRNSAFRIRHSKLRFILHPSSLILLFACLLLLTSLSCLNWSDDASPALSDDDDATDDDATDDDATDDDANDDVDDDIDDDDDDDDDTQPPLSCEDIMVLVYDVCEGKFVWKDPPGEDLTKPEALDECLSGDSFWECVDACFEEVTGNCDDLEECINDTEDGCDGSLIYN
jgi:hypothetical protein